MDGVLCMFVGCVLCCLLFDCCWGGLLAGLFGFGWVVALFVYGPEVGFRIVGTRGIWLGC